MSAGQHAVNFTNRETKIWTAEHARERAVLIPVLVVSPIEDDRRILRKILKPPAFRLRSARSLSEAEPLIRRARIPAIIAECDLGDGSWKNVWEAIQASEACPRPRLIVATAEPHERLWTEVMLTGAFDVLEKPFDRTEATWVVVDAWSEWQREQQLCTAAGARAARRGAA